MRRICFALLCATTSGCYVQTYNKVVQTGCATLGYEKVLTKQMVMDYHGAARAPDEINELDDGRTELVYYFHQIPEQGPPYRLWTGKLVFFLWVPVLPLLYPDGYHQTSFIISKLGTVEQCTNIGHETKGGPPPIT